MALPPDTWPLTPAVRPPVNSSPLPPSPTAPQAQKSRLDHWLQPGLVVKVVAKELKEAGYYKQKVRRCHAEGVCCSWEGVRV